MPANTVAPVHNGAVPELTGLIECSATGDQVAFTKLYDLMAGRVLGLSTRILQDRAQAEEVTQEIFLEVWRQAPRYEPGRGSGYTWLMTIAHRRAVDRVRTSQATHQRDLRVGIRDFEPVTAAVDEEVELVMASEKVASALGHLTELQGQAVRLAYYGGLSAKEIAANLKVPVGTIKTRIRDGLIRLRDELEVNG